MNTEFIAMLYYSAEHAAWLALTGWDAPATARDAMGALRQVERETDRVLAEQGEPAHTPFVLIAGSIASDTAPHRVRKVWRLAPELADRLLEQLEQRGAEEAIEEALEAWRADADRHGEDTESLDLDDYEGIDCVDLARRAVALT